jgi:alpha-L-arabinofuranosidase
MACTLEGPGFDVPIGADLGAAERDIPFVDAVAYWKPGTMREGGGFYLTAVNLHLEDGIRLSVTMPGLPLLQQGQLTSISHRDITARATLVNPQPFSLTETGVTAENGTLVLDLPPASLNIAWFPVRE